MRRRLVLALSLGAASAASAHVAPSVDDNNRYLKLTPLGDRVRLAYVIFYGEIPGARLRPAIDTDHDGAISDAEGQAFGTRIGAEVAAALDVSIDGAPQRIAWSVVSAGMGSPQVAAGSFSLDLVASLCLPGGAGRGRHELRLIDRLRLPRPGETELRVEDSPGVRIERSAVGDEHDTAGTFRFRGPGGALAEGGLALAFTVGDGALAPGDGACAAAPRGRGAPPAAAIAGAAAAAAALGGTIAALAIRRRRRRARERVAHARDQSART